MVLNRVGEIFPPRHWVEGGRVFVFTDDLGERRYDVGEFLDFTRVWSCAHYPPIDEFFAGVLVTLHMQLNWIDGALQDPARHSELPMRVADIERCIESMRAGRELADLRREKRILEKARSIGRPLGAQKNSQKARQRKRYVEDSARKYIKNHGPDIDKVIGQLTIAGETQGYERSGLESIVRKLLPQGARRRSRKPKGQA